MSAAHLRALPAHAHQDPAYIDPQAAALDALSDVAACISALTTLATLDPQLAAHLAWQAANVLAPIDREAFAAIKQRA